MKNYNICTKCGYATFNGAECVCDKNPLPLPSQFLGGQEVLSIVTDNMQVIFDRPPHSFLNKTFSKNEEVTVLILNGAPK